MGHGESQASQIVRRGAECGRSDLVQASGIRRRNIERALRVLQRVTHSMIHPQGNFQLLGNLHGLLTHGLAHGQRHSGSDVGDILAQDETQRRTPRSRAAWASASGRAAESRSCRPTNFASSSAMPEWKRSGPTRVRRAKLASSDARGEPIPITLPFATLSLKCCRADAAEVGWPFSTGWRIRRSLLTNS